MPNNVLINGASVDAEDPCALYQALYAIKVQILAGEHVEEFSIRSPVTQETFRVATAKLSDLNKELSRLADACSQANGGKRKRFAIRAGFRS